MASSVMNIAMAILPVLFALLVVLIGMWLWRRPRKLKAEYFHEKWKQLQQLLRDKTQWADAIISADQLLDEALRKKHVAGNSMGARLVKAQRTFTDNDSVWYSHKLRNKIDADPTTKLKQGEVKQALMGVRQALKDMGALK